MQIVKKKNATGRYCYPATGSNHQLQPSTCPSCQPISSVEQSAANTVRMASECHIANNLKVPCCHLALLASPLHECMGRARRGRRAGWGGGDGGGEVARGGEGMPDRLFFHMVPTRPAGVYHFPPSIQSINQISLPLLRKYD